MNKQETLTQAHPAGLLEAGSQRRLPRKAARLAGYLMGILLMIGLAALGVWLARVWRGNPSTTGASQPADVKAPASYQRPVVSDAGLVERSGVRIVLVAVTGGGGLIDLRYQVIDPDKAAALHNDATPPILVDQTTGVVVNSLLMGHSHSGSYQAGQTYYLIFENPGNLVQSGGKVSVLLGDAEVDDVNVR